MTGRFRIEQRYQDSGWEPTSEAFPDYPSAHARAVEMSMDSICYGMVRIVDGTTGHVLIIFGAGGHGRVAHEGACKPTPAPSFAEDVGPGKPAPKPAASVLGGLLRRFAGWIDGTTDEPTGVAEEDTDDDRERPNRRRSTHPAA